MESNRRRPPYHGVSASTGRNPPQRFGLVSPAFVPIRFATDCHRLQPLGKSSLRPDLSTAQRTLGGDENVFCTHLQGAAVRLVFVPDCLGPVFVAPNPTSAKPATAPSMNKSALTALGIPRACVSTTPEVQTVSV
jgi:hypothetical protein